MKNVLQKFPFLRSCGRMMRAVSLALVAAMLLSTIMTAEAAPVNIKDVFDAEFYSDTYGDLAAAFSNDAKALYRHYQTYGQKEGRMVVPFIDLVKYREAYSDLNIAFGDDWNKYLDHYIKFGVYEGRNAFGVSFDARAYADRYPDLKAAFGYDVLALYNHYVKFGFSEGRNPMPDVPARSVNTSHASSSGSGPASTPTTPVSESVATTVTFRDENGNPIPNAVVRFNRVADIGMNRNAGSVSGGDAGSVSGGDVVIDGDTIIVTTDENGQYTVPELPAGVYNVEASAPGYLTLNMTNVVVGTSGDTQTIPTFEMLSADMSGSNTVQGYAKDATSGLGIAGVTINIRADWNNRDGAVIATLTSDEEGAYSIELTRGYYTIEFVRDGYASAFVNIATSNLFNADRCSGIMSPTMSEVTSDQYRIVLTWGEEPSDLDSHLVGPANDGCFHVFYANKSYIEGDTVVASLDVDDVSSYGPETITVVNVQPDKTYYYSVHDFTNGGAVNSMYLARSSANVKVYSGSELVKEYNVPADQPGTVWNVFRIVNGSIVSINDVNENYDSMSGDYDFIYGDEDEY